jgi:TPP-dependent pyruvate/acetoin dehydrogenase alpha subunit
MGTKKEDLLEEHGLDTAQARDLLRQMWEIRMFEDRVYDLLGRNIIKGASHLYAGEEAVAVGAISVLRDMATAMPGGPSSPRRRKPRRNTITR